MQVNIRRWTSVGTWRYNIETSEECTICQSPFEIPCSKCTVPADCVPGGLTSQGKVQPLLSSALH